MDATVLLVGTPRFAMARDHAFMRVTFVDAGCNSTRWA